MNPPEPNAGTPPPRSPGGSEGIPASAPSQSASGVLWILLAPGALCFLLGLGSGNGAGFAPLILLVSFVGSLIAGIAAGRRMARRYAGGADPSVATALGCCVLGIFVAGALSFGGCFVGLVSTASFR